MKCTFQRVGMNIVFDGGIKMEKYYFTFGSDIKYPYQNGYIIVQADNLNQAIEKFRNKYPDRNKGVVNCAFWYSHQQWKNTTMCKNKIYPCYKTIY